jgi:hypothetical protein
MRLSSLRWLAVLPIVLALPYLFFGILWTAAVQLVVGVLLVGVGVGMWIALADRD